MLKVISTKRCCKSFIKWEQGFTPKEHREMVDRRSMVRMQIAMPIIAAIVGGLIALGAIWLQKTPVVNNYIQVPTPITQPLVPGPTDVQSPDASGGHP